MTNNMAEEVYDHSSHDGLKEGITGFASVTKGDVPSSSNPTYGQTEAISAINVTNVSTVDVSNDSPNTPESSNVPTGNDESAIPHTSTAGLHSTNPSYANKLSPASLTKANLRKLESNVSNDADCNIWLPLALVHEFSSLKGVDSVLRNGLWMIRGITIFLNKWSPTMSLQLEELCRVLTFWVKFHDV
ncbi:retrotransposon protein, putative, ty1-copia subclass [Tanacetum coccineum]